MNTVDEDQNHILSESVISLSAVLDYMRYPFMTAVNEFMNVYKGIYSEGMYSELERRYPKISRQIQELRDNNMISTTNPRDFLPEDIREYAKYLRSRGLKPTSIGHDISSLNVLCKFCGNSSVETARIQYPLLFPRGNRSRLPITERPEFDRIVEDADKLTADDDYRIIRAYAMSLFAFGTGSRTQELQFAELDNLSPDLMSIRFTHVKGMDTYGEPRTVPIRPEVRPILELYLKVRRPSDSGYIFPNQKGGYLSTNILTRERGLVVRGSGIVFDYRQCRRTYGQYLIDEGFTVDQVAVILGHSNSRTTEKSYGRPRDDRVMSDILTKWNNKENE